MAAFLAQKTVKLLIARGINPIGARVRVRVLGLTFKEDVPDLRNTKALADGVVVIDVKAKLARDPRVWAL